MWGSIRSQFEPSHTRMAGLSWVGVVSCSMKTSPDAVAVATCLLSKSIVTGPSGKAEPSKIGGEMMARVVGSTTLIWA